MHEPMASSLVTLDIDRSVATLTMDDGKRNALSLTQLLNCAECLVCLLSVSGKNAFVAAISHGFVSLHFWVPRRLAEPSPMGHFWARACQELVESLNSRLFGPFSAAAGTCPVAFLSSGAPATLSRLDPHPTQTGLGLAPGSLQAPVGPGGIGTGMRCPLLVRVRAVLH